MAKIEELIEKLKAGAHVVTSKSRLARHISHAYDSSMLSQGLKAWETPRVTDFDLWLVSLLTGRASLCAGSTLLSKGRALALWEEAVSSERGREPSGTDPLKLPYRNSLLRDSYEAYRLLKEYRTKLSANNIYLTEEARALKRWSAVYERLLEEKGFICPSAFCSLVAELIEKREIAIEGELIFAGFEVVSPAMQYLVKAIEANGVNLTFWPGPHPQTVQGDSGALEGLIDTRGVRLLAFPDKRGEVAQAARWAREMASEGKKAGLIVTDPTGYRELIEREFRAELEPASLLLENAGSISDTFNISFAAPLSESPLVACALDLLSITEPGAPIETERLFTLFSSPYLNTSTKGYIALAALDKRLRSDNRSDLTLNAFSKALLREGEGPLTAFKERIDKFIKCLKDKRSGFRDMPSIWAGRLFTNLRDLGWPGDMEGLTSREFQAFEAFSALLADFAGLDDIAGPITRRVAAERLRRMAEARAHQPKNPETLVEVIAIGEAAGFEFDSIWIVGASDETLPPGIDPNPFIPIRLQKELGFRRASIEMEAQLSIERLVRFIKDARVVVVSYPEVTEAREVRVSPYFASLEAADKGSARVSKRLKDSVLSSSLLEDMAPEDAVAFAPGEIASMRGGTSILKDQSACPFKAFATFRLGASVVDSPEAGLSYMERGSIVHSALAHFWEDVGDSVALNKLISDERLIQQIRLSVDFALEPYNKRSFGEAVHYLNIERQRLRRLLGEWLRYEAARAPFKVVSLESADEIEISGLKAKVRIDRVDAIGAIGHAVIDYKSGKCNRNDWLGERPKDPQMLVYNLAGPYEALAFGSLRPGQCKIEGIAKSEGILPKNNGFEKDSKIKRAIGVEEIDSFEKLTDSWRVVVEALASDFVDGKAGVDPNMWNGAKGQAACAYSHCELKALCRIFESEVIPEEELRGETR